MYLQNTLGEDRGSGHFYLARNRTFLLCVDTWAGTDGWPKKELARLARTDGTGWVEFTLPACGIHINVTFRD